MLLICVLYGARRRFFSRLLFAPFHAMLVSMTIEQTVEIPADHRVILEFLAPREIPVGKARIELKVTPVVEKPADRKPAPKNAGEQAEISVSATPNSFCKLLLK